MPKQTLTCQTKIWKKYAYKRTYGLNFHGIKILLLNGFHKKPVCSAKCNVAGYLKIWIYRGVIAFPNAKKGILFQCSSSTWNENAEECNEGYNS